MRRICRVCRRSVPSEHVALIGHHERLPFKSSKGGKYPVCAATVETILGWEPCGKGPSELLSSMDIVNIAASKARTARGSS